MLIERIVKTGNRPVLILYDMHLITCEYGSYVNVLATETAINAGCLHDM